MSLGKRLEIYIFSQNYHHMEYFSFLVEMFPKRGLFVNQYCGTELALCAFWDVVALG